MIKKINWIVALVLLGGNCLLAQDVHFSQFITTSTFLNPASTGKYEGNYRATVNMREQYSTFNNAYKTAHFSFDMPLGKKKSKKNTGIGLNIFHDVAGDSKTKTFHGKLNISQTVRLFKKSDFSVGVSVGFAQLSANYTALNWHSQFNGLGYDQNLPSNEQFSARNHSFFDLSTGFLYRHYGEQQLPLEIGFAIDHLTTPTLSGSLLDFLPMKYSLIAKQEIQFRKNPQWGLVPFAVGSRQSNVYNLNFGILARVLINKLDLSKKNILFFGAGYRHFDAITPQFYLKFNNKFRVGFSYDINISGLKAGSNYRGGAEISISFTDFTEKFNIISPITF